MHISRNTTREGGEASPVLIGKSQESPLFGKNYLDCAHSLFKFVIRNVVLRASFYLLSLFTIGVKYIDNIMENK